MSFLTISQIIIAVALTVVILLQQRGAGGSAIFGEGSSAGYFRRRGIEKTLSWLTVILAALFLVFSLIRISLS